MAFQNLGYRIDVNDAELRLATQHVAAFNAEIAASTVTGRKMDVALRSMGRRAAQTGAFFTRNLTLPIGLVGLATGKLTAEFQKQFAKIGALTNTSAAGVERLKKAALELSSRVITEGPEKLAEALFFERSAGFSLEQSLRSLEPIAKGAASGLGSIATVADSVANALDAFGIAGSRNATKLSISAQQAVAILIGTVAQGKVATDQLAGSIGRVIPIANALGISFDQVGASIATMTRQGLNANLAVTGLRALFQTFSKAQPQTEKALATIGTSAEAVRKSLKDPDIGVFTTLIALRQQFNKELSKPLPTLADKKGGLTDLAKTALTGDALALAKIKDQVGDANEALAKLFPNVRALTAFLIITGPRQVQNASIFARLKIDALDSAEVIRRAYAVKAKTAIGQFELAVSQLKTEAIQIGPTFINAATGVIKFVNGITGFFEDFGSRTRGIIKDVVIGLALFGPLIGIFGRLTQAASFGVTMWGRWQEAATKAAFAARGINVEEDELIIETRKATVVFEQSMNAMTAAANRTTAAVKGIATATGGAAVAAAKASGGVAALGKIKGKERPTRAQRGAIAQAVESAGPAAASATAIVSPAAAGDIDARVKRLQTARQEAEKAAAALTAAQTRSAQFGVSPRQSGAEAAAQRLVVAQREVQKATAAVPAAIVRSQGVVASAEAASLTAAQRLVAAESSLAAAKERQVKFSVSARAAGTEAAEVEIAEIRKEIAAREIDLSLAEKQLLVERERVAQTITTQQQTAAALQTRQLIANTTPQGFFANINKKDAAIRQSARITQDANVRAARVSANAWDTAMVGIKSAGALAFDFVALTFAANLLGKVVFDSHKTKDAVTHDLFDIHKAGIGAAAGVGLIASVAIPKLLGAVGKVRGGATAFEALGIATLNWRVKLGVTLAAVLGLQQAGVKLESVFNAVLIGLAARAVVTAGIVRGAFTGIAASAGLAELATSVGAVTAAFGGWPIAIGIASAVILAQTPPIEAALGKINDAFGALGKNIDDLNGKGGGHFFEDFFKHGLFAKGGVHPGGVGFGPSGDDLRNSKGVTGETDKQKKNTAQMQADAQAFAKLIKGLPPAVQKAATELHQGGKNYAADQLIATARAKEQFAQVKAAVALFKKEGKPGIARLLGETARTIKDSKAALDKQFGVIQDGVLRSFDVHTDRLLDTFDRQTDGMVFKFDRVTENITRTFDQKTSDMLEAFDRQTSKLEDKLKVNVNVPKLNEKFTVTVNGKTPAERELAALDKVEAKRHFQRDIFDANKTLATSLQIGDPQAIRDAERQRQDAVAEKRRFDLERRAEKERAAADKAIPAAKDKFDHERETQRRAVVESRRIQLQGVTDQRRIEERALNDRRELLRRDLDAQRAVERDKVQAAIEAEVALFDAGKIKLGKFLADILKLMKQHNLTVQQLGAEGGKAYGAQLAAQLDSLKTSVQKDMDAITHKLRETNAKMKGLAADFQKNFNKIVTPSLGKNGVLLPPTTPQNVAANQAQQQQVAQHTAARAGLPTRRDIVEALHSAERGRNQPQQRAAFERYETFVPKRGEPSQAEYRAFIQKLDPETRLGLRRELKREGFFKAAGGGVVPTALRPAPDRVGTDTVHALLTPNEIVLNSGHQGWLQRVLGVGGGAHGLFGFVDRAARGVQRFAKGGVAEKRKLTSEQQAAAHRLVGAYEHLPSSSGDDPIAGLLNRIADVGKAEAKFTHTIGIQRSAVQALQPPGQFATVLLGETTPRASKQIASIAKDTLPGLVKVATPAVADAYDYERNLVTGHGGRPAFARSRAFYPALVAGTVAALREDFTHPRERPGFLAADILGLLSGGAGIASRTIEAGARARAVEAVGRTAEQVRARTTGISERLRRVALEDRRRKARATRAAGLPKNIESLRESIAGVANREIRDWQPEFDEFGDPEVGFGGICDRIAAEIQGVLAEKGFITRDGGFEGDEHAWVVAGDKKNAYVVDVPYHLYERRQGFMQWEKLEGATIRPQDVEFAREGPVGEFFEPEDLHDLAHSRSVHDVIAHMRAKSKKLRHIGGRLGKKLAREERGGSSAAGVRPVLERDIDAIVKRTPREPLDAAVSMRAAIKDAGARDTKSFVKTDEHGIPQAAVAFRRAGSAVEIENMGSMVPGGGTEMVKLAARAARADGLHQIKLTSLEGARGFYKRLGFHETRDSGMLLEGAPFDRLAGGGVSNLLHRIVHEERGGGEIGGGRRARHARGGEPRWGKVDLSDIHYNDADDDFYYHITPAGRAASIVKNGLVPNRGTSTMAEGFYRDYSRGKVFFTERSAAKFWADRIEEHLEHQMDNPPKLAAVRIPKKDAPNVRVDELGTRDAGGRRAYFSESPIGVVPAHERRNSASRIGKKIREEHGGSREPWMLTRDEFAPFPKKHDDRSFRKYRQRRTRWEEATARAVSLGKLDPRAARERGFNKLPPVEGTVEGWAPLPKTLYHVTTAKSAVERGGLKTRSELGQERGLGLGGGPDDLISFTSELATAQGIARSLREVRRVARGDLTVKQMIASARKGKGARSPWLQAIRQSDVDEALTPFVHNHRESTVLLLSAEEAKARLGPEWFPEPGANAHHTPGGDKFLGRSFVRPKTRDERLEAALQFHKAWSAHRERAGGPVDPLFFSADSLKLRNVAADQIKILRYSSQPGTLGIPALGLREWRVPTGEAVRLDGVERFKDGGVVGDRFHHDRPEAGRFALDGAWPGLLERGNINLLNRPSVKNSEGGMSSVFSTSFKDRFGREVLVPQVIKGHSGQKRVFGEFASASVDDPSRIVSPTEAWQHYLDTGRHLGIFDTAAHANKYASALHFQQARLPGFNSGGPVPGFGTGDTVHALLTPNEIVLNSGHQEWLKRTLGVGGNAHGLFNFIDSHSGGGGFQRFAAGGVVLPTDGGKGLRPIIPGFNDLKKALDKMIVALTRSAIGQERASQDSHLLHELLLGGTFVGKGKARHFVKDTEEETTKLRRRLDPKVSVENLISGPQFAKLSPQRRAELRAKVAQVEAHPVTAGLVTVDPKTGRVVAGSVKRLPFSQGPVAVQTHARRDGSSDVGGGVTIERVDIHISGAKQSATEIAKEVRRELLKTSDRNSGQRRGRNPGVNIGAR